jgi:hypothetical protein
MSPTFGTPNLLAPKQRPAAMFQALGATMIAATDFVLHFRHRQFQMKPVLKTGRANQVADPRYSPHEPAFGSAEAVAPVAHTRRRTCPLYGVSES